MFNITGIIKYYNNTVSILLDENICKYYYSLIPKYYYANKQMSSTHITVVRPFETPNRTKWGIREGWCANVQYSPLIKYKYPYFFLDAYSEEAAGIREELGLLRYRYPYNCYHITIGNIKNI